MQICWDVHLREKKLIIVCFCSYRNPKWAEKLTYALKHDKSQRNAHHGISHAKCFSSDGDRCGMSISYHCKDNCCKIKSSCKFPLRTCFVGLAFYYHHLHHFVVLFCYFIFFLNVIQNLCKFQFSLITKVKWWIFIFVFISDYLPGILLFCFLFLTQESQTLQLQSEGKWMCRQQDLKFLHFVFSSLTISVF